jgi:uncharacterized protein
MSIWISKTSIIPEITWCPVVYQLGVLMREDGDEAKSWGHNLKILVRKALRCNHGWIVGHLFVAKLIPMSGGINLGLALVGFFVGALNALAGGGSLISFPFVLATGIGAVKATTTNALGISSANFTALIAQRKEFKKLFHEYKLLILISSIFATIGAIALLIIPERYFEKVIPFLLLAATLTILMPLRKAGRYFTENWERVAIASSGFYCGYFGPGQGIIVIAALSRRRPIKDVNVAKNIIIGLTTIFSNAIYFFSGRVAWGLCATLFVTSSLGGWVGGHMSMRISPKVLRTLVFFVGISASIWLFKKYYF